MATTNTRGLNKVYSAMANFEAKDFVYRHNLAATSLLLKINLPNAHEIARELYAKHPEEAIITATYAYSLHLQGRTREGLAALEKLKAESIELPQVALYYGVLLSAIGETNKARKYLELAQHANVLPEADRGQRRKTSSPCFPERKQGFLFPMALSSWTAPIFWSLPDEIPVLVPGELQSCSRLDGLYQFGFQRGI